MPTEFVVPGQNRRSAALDLARTVVRRAERLVAVDGPVDGGRVDPPVDAEEGSQVGPYLNRLSDLLWTMARWQEGDQHIEARGRPAAAGRTGGQR